MGGANATASRNDDAGNTAEMKRSDMANMAKLDEVMAIVEAEVTKYNISEDATGAGLWDQTVWAHKTSCGTSYCFAGWRAALDGDITWGDPFSNRRFVAVGVVVDGKPYSIYDWAKKACGISGVDAMKLFYAMNSLQDLRRMVKDLREFGTIMEFNYE
jgi:hypothetical protein